MSRIFRAVVLALFPCAACVAADVSYFGILKVQEFVQTPTNAPAAVANGYSFHAIVVAADEGLVTNATVARAGTTPANVLLPRGTDFIFEFEQRFASLSALDTAYPNGNIFSPVNYTITMATLNDGLRTNNLSFASVAALGGYPATPHISNLPAAQALDATRDFTLQWNSLGGGSTEIVQLTIFDSQSNAVFATPAPFQPGALNGTSTSAVIPAGSLPNDSQLSAHLTVARPGLPNTSYATGIPAFSKDTSFPLRTRPGPPAPFIAITPRFPDVELTFSTEPDRVYHLQASPDLSTWNNLLATNATATSVRIETPASSPAQFYRVQVGP